MTGEDVDARFSLANERTYLAWIRTALAVIAGGLAAGKGLRFHHELVRWAIAVPPVLAGAALAAHAPARWRTAQDALEAGRPLPVGRGFTLLAGGLTVYALLALLAIALD
jgi:putative membrane protein